MIRFKKIISILLVIATIFSVMVVPAFATSGDAWAWVQSKFHDWVYNQYGLATDGSDNFWYQLFQPDDGECNHVWTYNSDGVKYCSVCGMTWDDYLASKYDTSYEDVDGGGRSAYSDYVTGLDSTLGTYTVTNNGLRLYFSLTSTYRFSTVTLGTNFYAAWTAPASTSYRAQLYMNYLTLPFDCSYSVGYNVSQINMDMDSIYASLADDGTAAKGTNLGPCGVGTSTSQTGIYCSPLVGSSLSSISGSFYVDIVPVSGSLSDNVSADVSSASRAGSIAAPLGYYDTDNNLQVNTSGTPIVDEANNTYYNPLTNNTTNITNWTYDYSDRSYTVTTEAGDTYTITYGDTNITINEGDTVYNVYYVIGDDSSSDDSTGWDWWKTEWTDFRTWLSGLSFVGGGDSSELTDSPDSSGSSSSSSSGDTSAFYSIDDATGDITINQDYDYSGEEDGLDFGGVVKATGKGIWWLAKSVIGIFAGAITNVGSAVSGLAKIGKASNTTGAYGFFFQ